MPALLNNQQFPIGYSPWYVYRASLVAAPSTFDKFDVLVPDAAGAFDRAGSNEVLLNGYAIALEQFRAGMTTLPVAAAGSLVPSVAGGALRPNGLLKIAVDANQGMRLVAADAADLAAGMVLGRYRNKGPRQDHINLTAAAANDRIDVLTGVL